MNSQEESVAERLRRVLEQEIDSGRVAEGTRLGNERDLAETHRVSRGTLRRALAALEEAGLIRRVPGRSGGTFVSKRRVQRDSSDIEGVPGYLARQGYQAGTTILGTSLEPARGRVRDSLDLKDDDWVYSIRRLRLADGSPYSLDDAYFPTGRFPDLIEKSLGGSIYELLEHEFDVTAQNATELIEVVRATEEEADLLAVAPGDPLLLIRRTTFDVDNVPFEYSSDLLRADRTRIHTTTPGLGIRSSGRFVELRQPR